MKRALFVAVCLLWVAALGRTAVVAQHTTRPRDPADGERIYRSTCALCHGADGVKVGGVDLASGHFRRAANDDDLARVIRNGVPGTAMPSHKFSDDEIGNLIAFLRNMRKTEPTDAAPAPIARGQAVFEGKGLCLSCHRVRGKGGFTGPALIGIGQLLNADELKRAILDPAAEVLYTYRTVQATTRTGATVTGRVLNEDAFTVQVLDGNDHLKSLTKADLRSLTILRQSPMPSYRNTLTPQELSDLIAYLLSIKVY